METERVDSCSFCGLPRCDDEAAFCTGCGRPLLVASAVRSMDMNQTTANYDPYHRDWKPWREPTVLKKRPKKKNDSFYNKNVWGKNVPRRPLPKQPAPASGVEGSAEDRGELVFSDHLEYGGVRFRGFVWKKPSFGLIKRRKKRDRKPEEACNPLVESDIISPLAVYPAPWISPTAVVHVSLVEAVRVSEHRQKRSKCWFRIGVTDSAWKSIAAMATSPLVDRSESRAAEDNKKAFPSTASHPAAIDGVPSMSFNSGDSEEQNPLTSVDGSHDVDVEDEDDSDELLVLQYVDNHVAKFIVGRDSDWVDAAVIDANNTYMLEHLQRTLEALAQRVVVSSTRAAEESYDQLSFIDAKTLANYTMGATLTMHNYFPLQSIPREGQQEAGAGKGSAEVVDNSEAASAEPPKHRVELQLYFDQTIFQTVVRIPLGGHYRGEYITCMARVEALNSCPDYVSYVCRRLDINEEDIKIDRHDSSSSQPRYGSSEEPVVAAFKFLIVPLLMKENIRPKILVLSLASLSVLLESPFELNALLTSDELDPKQELVCACLQIIEAIRFEKVRSGSNGNKNVDVRAVLSGVLNTFDIVDIDDEADISLPISDHAEPRPCSPKEPSAGDQSAAAFKIQKQWRRSFDCSERKREERMQESLAASVIKIQCMFRAFKARRFVQNKKSLQSLPSPEPVIPKVVADEHWRLDDTGKIVRTCVIRGTPLHLSATTIRGHEGKNWDYIFLVATLCEDGTTSEEDIAPPEAFLKLWRERLSNDIYVKPAQLASNICEDSADEQTDVVKTILTNVFSHLDLFYAGKNGVMILKFNGPE